MILGVSGIFAYLILVSQDYSLCLNGASCNAVAIQPIGQGHVNLSPCCDDKNWWATSAHLVFRRY